MNETSHMGTNIQTSNHIKTAGDNVHLLDESSELREHQATFFLYL